MSRLLTIALLTATYLLVLDSVHLLDVAAGVVVAVCVVALLAPLLFSAPAIPGVELAKRIARFPRFAAAVVWEIVLGTWQVALVVMGLRPLLSPGIIAVPVGDRSQTGIAVTTLAITLSPGELLVDIDEDRELMLIHVLDARDPDGVRERYAAFYERYQRGVFP